MPQFVDEHDMIPDLKWTKNNGTDFSTEDRSQYKQDITKIYNRYKSHYTFWGFPSEGADPFGYSDDMLSLRESSGVPYADGADKNKSSSYGSGTFGMGKALTKAEVKERAKFLADRNKKLKYNKINVIRKIKYGNGLFGRGNRAAEVWNWFTTHGYSDAATAGILGNMEQESGVDPEVIQGNGAGPAAGIVQWENYNTKSSRWKLMSDYAASKGRDWTDLESQLEFIDKENSEGNDVFWSLASPYNSYDKFKAATDIKGATDSFEQAFERAGTPMMENRYTAAQNYYTKFNGTGGTPISGSVGATTSGNTTTGGAQTGGANGDDGLNSIGQFLSNVIANSPAAQVLNSFLDFGSSGSSSGGTVSSGSSGSSAGGVVGDGSAASVVKVAEQELATAEQERASGKYNNTTEKDKDNNVKYNTWYYGKEVIGDQYPWCAAFVSWVNNQAGVPESIFPKDAYTVTAYQYFGEHGGTYPKNADGKPGDIIYYTDNGSPSGIYHTGIVKNVENGTINTIEGNSGDTVAARTPSVSSSKVLLARPAYAIQSTGNAASSTSTTSSTTSATTQQEGFSDDGIPDASMTLGSNGIKPISKYGTFKESLFGTGTVPYIDGTPTRRVQLRDSSGYYTVEKSPWDIKAGRALRNSKLPKYGMGVDGIESVDPYIINGSSVDNRLIKQIVEILLTVASNTDKLNTIVTILQEKLNINITAQDVSNAQAGNSTSEKLANAIVNNGSATSKLNSYADTVGDNSIYNIIQAMNAIASE